ncbi:hypothetical protein DIS24_g11806 [Lasiodiplodia hormozganensis]|uniref:F-box domain-containing protein n=1 Tax=Lasiodiplodia hormozganensis TaxID=869390 RepID=A0AA39WHF2_9PEZI|nr:hypothetical protein DIS24_g11806 [Lasiodiplodia hormozganensis]
MCRATTTYCCICGCPFSSLDVDPDVRGSPYSYDSSVLASEDTDWLRQCNAVDQDTFFVEDDEGPRRVEGIDSLLQAFEQIESSRQSTINKFLRGSELDGPVYAMHSACMDIAEHARRYRFFRGAHPEPSTNAVLQNFYGSLKRLHYRIASQSHSVRWEHGYYGAARFWRNFWGQERGWEWLCADPANIPELTEWVLTQLRPVSDDASSSSPLKYPVDDTREYPRPALDGMPIDVLRRITSFLPAPATLRLRRCSKALANRIELRQSFWRDGLVAGDLVSFLWDLDAEKCRQKDRSAAQEEGLQYDWRALARGLRAHKFVQAALRKSLARRPVEGYGIGYLDFYRSVAAQDGEFETDAPVGLLNRCRIVQVVEDVEHIEDDELHDCHVPLSDEEEIYAAMWIMQVSQPEKFDEYRIRRSLELYGDLSEVLESRPPRMMCRL